MGNNRFLGAVLIVAGTTIGAGMLALPITSIQSGYWYSIGLMGVMWAFMCFSALIAVELNIYAGKPKSLALLSQQFLGNKAFIIASLATAMLFYSLIAAYIDGGSSVLYQLMPLVPKAIFAILFALLIAAPIVINFKAVDLLNRPLFVIKTSLFILLLCWLLPGVTTENIATHQGELSYLHFAIPIFFTSFGFHGCIASITDYVGLDRKQLVPIMVWGSLVALVVYFAWVTVTLGALTSEVAATIHEQPNLANLVEMLQKASEQLLLKMVVNAFAFFSMATSFLGVAIGLFSFLAEKFTVTMRDSENTVQNITRTERYKIAFITLFPPLLITMFCPGIFIEALGFAAIALALLAVIIPSLMGLIILNRNANRPYNHYILNKPALLLNMVGGVSVVVIELMHKVT